MIYRALIIRPRSERSIIHLFLGGPFWAILVTVAFVVLNWIGVI